MMPQQSCRAELSLFECVDLAHTAHVYSARWTPRYTGFDVLSRPVPLQVTFSSRLASLFLR